MTGSQGFRGSNYLRYSKKDCRTFLGYNLDCSFVVFDNLNIFTISGCSVQFDKNVEIVLKLFNINSETKSQFTDFAVQGGRIYFTHMYDNGTLYSINIDGSDMRKLNDDNTPQFYVSGNKIYYLNGSDSSKLYSITTKGKEKRKLSDDQTGIKVFTV